MLRPAGLLGQGQGSGRNADRQTGQSQAPGRNSAPKAELTHRFGGGSSSGGQAAADLDIPIFLDSVKDTILAIGALLDCGRVSMNCRACGSCSSLMSISHVSHPCSACL
jgi:hypothetical protein